MLLIRLARSVEALPGGAIIDGAPGDVADRLHHRAVTDLLDFHFEATHWPVSDMADVFVTGGTGEALLVPWLSARRAASN